MSPSPLPVPPSAQRNASPIRDVLSVLFTQQLRPNATVLEIASGSGHHAAVMAAAMPQFTWQPSERDAQGHAEVEARVAEANLPNLRPPLILDVQTTPWPIAQADALLCINMIHISPWEATHALFAGAARLMPGKGLVVTYGPYRIDRDWGAESNRMFDASLQQRNPSWGVRELRDVERVAAAHGFALHQRWPMPANNFTLAFVK